MTHVPFVDLGAQSRGLHDELHEVFESVLSRAAYTMGPELGEFEAAFAAFCDAGYCAGVSSGTDAGDEVVVPVNTFMASAEAVSHCGATPAFVDCLPGTANLDPSLLEGAITPRTKAILPVHLYGQAVARRLQGPALRLAGRHRRLQLLPRQEPRGAGRRRGGRDQRRRRRPHGAPAA